LHLATSMRYRTCWTSLIKNYNSPVTATRVEATQQQPSWRIDFRPSRTLTLAVGFPVVIITTN
jgi:hypothetical protein